MAALLVVAGCAPLAEPTPPPPPEIVMPAPAPEPEPPSPPPPRPAKKPPVPTVPAANPPSELSLPNAVSVPPQATPAPASAPPVTATPSAPAAAKPFARLTGLDQAAVRTLLGKPLQISDSPPATVWRYASQDCELDLYFYLDLQTGSARVLHYEVRGHNGTDQPQQRCYDELVTSRGPEAAPPAADHAR